MYRCDEDATWTGRHGPHRPVPITTGPQSGFPWGALVRRGRGASAPPPEAAARAVERVAVEPGGLGIRHRWVRGGRRRAVFGMRPAVLCPAGTDDPPFAGHHRATHRGGRFQRRDSLCLARRSQHGFREETPPQFGTSRSWMCLTCGGCMFCRRINGHHDGDHFFRGCMVCSGRVVQKCPAWRCRGLASDPVLTPHERLLRACTSLARRSIGGSSRQDTSWSGPWATPTMPR